MKIFRRKEYVYFVSYAYFSTKQSGFGAIEMLLTNKIKKYSDIKLIVEFLNKEIRDGDGNNCDCVVQNYIRLKTATK
jgi:hypothetical protein